NTLNGGRDGAESGSIRARYTTAVPRQGRETDGLQVRPVLVRRRARELRQNPAQADEWVDALRWCVATGPPGAVSRMGGRRLSALDGGSANQRPGCPSRFTVIGACDPTSLVP